MEEITTLFNGFFDYQLDVNAIATACKQCKLGDFITICAAICAYMEVNPIHEPGIRYEFCKALAFRICLINGVRRFGV
ncbi:hypothetical protein [Ruminococcus flavefaciens]|uniref:hypothetical protein n=1 Tax=Ruminococcus flavefaciens TaxID=1265 RepID=UPI0026ED3BFA|nr:hypothetical protein [Ruminococcus flavefaciens]